MLEMCVIPKVILAPGSITSFEIIRNLLNISEATIHKFTKSSVVFELLNCLSSLLHSNIHRGTGCKIVSAKTQNQTAENVSFIGSVYKLNLLFV